MYKEMPKDAFSPHETWIIAFCPDTDSFFATNQRAFYWEFDKEFPTEKEAVEFFESHLVDFIKIDNGLMGKMMFNDIRKKDGVFLENTNRLYKISALEEAEGGRL